MKSLWQPFRQTSILQVPASGGREWRARRRLVSSAASSLVAAYKQRVDEGSCRFNDAQIPCLQRLETLSGELALAAASRGAPPRGVYIYGEPGAGKTMMMDMFHHAVTKRGLPSRRAHFHDFMLDMNSSLHRIRKSVGKTSDPLALVAREFVETSPLLCFDECHVLNVGDALLMRSFFEHLFKAGGTVVATSNLAPDELYSSGINREVFQPFIDAIMRHCDPIRLVVGEDFRHSKSAGLAATAGERTFFWPLGAEAEDKLTMALQAQVGPLAREPAAEDVQVPMGRTIHCRRVWRGGLATAAEFSYEELCVAAVGTYDYIALCQSFDIIVVRGVPRFHSTDENAARRFASMVDVLYDRSKRLLCTTDAPPKELFAAIRAQYIDGLDDDRGASVRMPSHGGSSGKHVAQFRLPQRVQYTESGGYSAARSDGNGLPDGAAVTQPDVDGGWVEWSATGLKDASMWDLTCHTKGQQHDRLLPLLRCESRLEEMSYL
mmetsp:Transcript_75566/g.179548  ORF Transcript_75566/g.179548 Transcript_75566/m.179548 type:complete len:492 (+) Transcript_75566:82-1557(+)